MRDRFTENVVATYDVQSKPFHENLHITETRTRQ
jgi:hypothetical protein